MIQKLKSSFGRIIVKHVEQKLVFVGVPVIIQNKKGEILLGKRDNKSIFYPLTWGLPGGMINYNESIEDAAKREVLEELGIEIKLIKRTKNIQENFPTKKCRLHTIDIAHYAKITKGKPKPKDETKEVRWFSPKEIKKMKLAYSHKEILGKEGLI
ncbi:MAG: NUDIX hydrolase [Candidatus Pacearchaeota archaeon]|nr:NUDIX hydrolase [Candidatus Pacearchaeota archaeon]